jgi:enoyl-CoA hydratase/carnithine racemase
MALRHHHCRAHGQLHPGLQQDRPGADSGGTWFLPQRVGLARAMALCLTGDKLSAQEAKAMGMIWDVQDDALAAARAMAERLAAMPTRALVATRHLLRGAHTHSLDEQLDIERDVQSRLGFTRLHRGRDGLPAKAPGAVQGRMR